MRYALPLILAACLFLTGCYHAQVTTGKTASTTVVEEKWAPSFFYGLVPATVDVSDVCQNGIASAERRLSFLNMLVGGLTLNIYLPQDVTVTCAAEGAMSSIDHAPDGIYVIPENSPSSQDAPMAEQ